MDAEFGQTANALRQLAISEGMQLERLERMHEGLFRCGRVLTPVPVAFGGMRDRLALLNDTIQLLVELAPIEGELRERFTALGQTTKAAPDFAGARAVTAS